MHEQIRETTVPGVRSEGRRGERWRGRRRTPRRIGALLFLLGVLAPALVLSSCGSGDAKGGSGATGPNDCVSAGQRVGELQDLIHQAQTLEQLQAYAEEVATLFERYPKLEAPFSDTPAGVRDALIHPTFEMKNPDGSIDLFKSAQLSMSTSIQLLPSLAEAQCRL